MRIVVSDTEFREYLSLFNINNQSKSSEEDNDDHVNELVFLRANKTQTRKRGIEKQMEDISSDLSDVRRRFSE